MGGWLEAFGISKVRNPFPENPLLTRAFELARKSHHGQTRKGGLPYITHPVAVARMLSAAGCSDATVAAGLLHDTLEDTPCEYEDLVKAGGEAVAAIVVQVTDAKTVPWADRKRNYLARLASASPEALAVSAADKTHNLLSIVEGLRAGGAFKTSFSAKMTDKIENYRSIYELIRSRQPSLKILQDYAAALEEATQLAVRP